MSRELEMAGTAVYGTVCAVVWEDGGREPSSYPMDSASVSGGKCCMPEKTSYG